MNSLLQHHRPNDISREDWDKTWNNSSYILQPLADVLSILIKDLEEIKNDDFDCPNHYAKLAFKEGTKQAFKKVLDWLPDSCK